MRFRKLRIAWSVVCGLASVLLIVLWVRSYWRLDAVAYKHPPKLAVYLVSSNGELRCEIVRTISATTPKPDMEINKLFRKEVPEMISFLDGGADECYVFDRPTELDPERGSGSGVLGFRLLGGGLVPVPVIPHWFAITVFGALGIVLGRGPFHFSLRTLLIATTLIAVMLGLICYVAQ